MSHCRFSFCGLRRCRGFVSVYLNGTLGKIKVSCMDVYISLMLSRTLLPSCVSCRNGVFLSAAYLYSFWFLSFCLVCVLIYLYKFSE